MATFLSWESRVFSDRSPCLQVMSPSYCQFVLDCWTGCAIDLVVTFMFGNYVWSFDNCKISTLTFCTSKFHKTKPHAVKGRRTLFCWRRNPDPVSGRPVNLSDIKCFVAPRRTIWTTTGNVFGSARTRLEQVLPESFIGPWQAQEGETLAHASRGSKTIHEQHRTTI